MRKNHNYQVNFETRSSEQEITRAVRIKDNVSPVPKRIIILISLFAASLVWCFSIPVRAEEISTEEVSTEGASTEEINTEEAGTEEVNTEEVNTKEINTEEAGTEATDETDSQSSAEQVEDFINSLLNGENETDGQSITGQIEDFILSLQNDEAGTDDLNIAGQIEDFILSLQNNAVGTDDLNIAGQIEDFILSFLNGKTGTDDQSIAGQVESFLSSLLNACEKPGMQAAAELTEDIPTTQYFTDEPVADEDIVTILTSGINSPSAMNSQSWHFSVITDASLLQQISDEMSVMMASFSPDTSSDTTTARDITEEADSQTALSTISDDIDETESTEDTEDTEETEESSVSASVTKAGIADAPLAIVISCAEGSELDAGLACQTMSIEAQLLGYGSKIISSPATVLNGDNQEEYRELLGIPDDYSVVAVLLVGYEDTSIDESMDGYTSATTRNSLDDMVTYAEP